MKFLILLLAVQSLIQWEPDFENAQKIAREKHELILLNFSGSDWCGPCIAFRKDYLESPEFTEYTADHLVLVNADFPRKGKNQLPAEIVKRNEKLAERYNRQGSFPFTLILDPEGRVLKTWTGKPQGSVDAWISELKALQP